VFEYDQVFAKTLSSGHI